VKVKERCPNCKIPLICIEWPNGLGGYDVACTVCGYYAAITDGGNDAKNSRSFNLDVDSNSRLSS
jgi:hypothetical protein